MLAEWRSQPIGLMLEERQPITGLAVNINLKTILSYSELQFKNLGYHFA